LNEGQYIIDGLLIQQLISRWISHPQTLQCNWKLSFF